MKNSFVFGILFYSVLGLTCSSFSISGPQGPVMAKNFDWDFGHGLLMVNKKNVRKTATLGDKLDTPLLWTSKYGSVTFNQLGRELPYGGMNEKGLSIEILWLDASEYPIPVPGIETVNESQWIQTLLDRAGSLEEMITQANSFQVHSAFAKVHYFACDSSGQCGIFEYLKSKLQVTKLTNAKDIRLITNNSFSTSKSALKDYQGFGGEKSIPQDGESLSRYVRGATLLENKSDSKPAVTRAFAILDGLKDSRTQWSIVYSPSTQRIYFKTKSSPSIKEVNIETFDYSCRTPVKVIDINTKLKGDISSQFEDYSKDLNTHLAERDLFVPEKFWKGMESASDQDNCI
jgi:penicillin V acylase-like amidase (Ntn superfamily)